MMDRQRALAEAVLADPDVVSVASFIGADGTNPTPNSGRLSIALKPRDERRASAGRDHGRGSGRGWPQVEGISALPPAGAGPARSTRR